MAGISARQLRGRYIIALSLIALLTIASNAWMQFLIADQEHDSRVVNVAGRQRMLSQRITKTALLLAETRSESLAARYFDELTGALALWQQSHVGLQKGDPGMELPGNNSDDVNALFATVEPHYRAMVAAGDTLRQSGDVEARRLAVKELLVHEADFLKGMDAIVFLYDREAKDKVLVARWIEMGLMAVTLLVLACEAAFIFAPATRRISNDMRELVRREEALAVKVRELEQTRDELVRSEKMASIGRMVAGFAHELNTPVGVAVSGSSHIESTIAKIRKLMQQDEVSEQALNRELEALDEAARLTMANLHRASQLVQSFKRTSIDQVSEQQRDYRMTDLIDDVIVSLSGVFKRSGIGIEVDCTVADTLHGDPGAIEQVLTNLLMNSHYHAYDEGRRNGRIAIRVREQPPGMLELDYSDDGIGMESSAVDRIFEPFFTTRRGQGGSGLGMYVAYNLVTDSLKGTIHCESKPGEGVRFHIRFPTHISGASRMPLREVTDT